MSGHDPGGFNPAFGWRDRTYTQSLASDLSAKNTTQYWQDFSWWPFWALVLVGASAITIGHAALDVFSLGSSFLALLIIGALVSGIESLGPSEGATFSGEGPFSGTIVSELFRLLAPTSGSALSTNLSAPSTTLTDVGTSVAMSNVMIAATPPAKCGWINTLAPRWD